jgi:hypothetical protein
MSTAATPDLFAELERRIPGLQPFSSSAAYSNLLGIDEGGRSRRAFGANYDRLAVLKKKYDPDNFFANNQNVAPV